MSAGALGLGPVLRPKHAVSKLVMASARPSMQSMSLGAGLNSGIKPLQSKNIAIRRSQTKTVGNLITCQAAVNAASESAPKEQSELVKTLILGGMFGVWYLFNIYFNIYNKQVLRVFPYPLTITAFQFAIGGSIACICWLFGILKRPQASVETLKTISPLAAVHTLGNALTNVSLNAVAVSFTHTIKAMEPFFSVLLSMLFLGDRPSALVLATLLPIIGGVGLASTSELSFTWTGFLAAMGSNVTFQSRNVLSKKFMIKGKGGLDNISLFSIITIMSFFILAPIALAVEGVKFTPAVLQAAGVDIPSFAVKALCSAFCFHMYQQISYMILQRVSPVTHSVGNCVKRVVVIVASVLVFHNPVTFQNGLGTGLALSGVFLYSMVKRASNKAEAAKAKAA